MIVESIYSSTILMLTCGSSVYSLAKHSCASCSTFFNYLPYACGGIVLISVRSFYVLIYKLFFKQYAFDPVIMEAEEEKDKERYNTFDEVLRIVSMSGLTFSLYCRYRHYVLGFCVITGLSVLDMFNIIQLEEEDSPEMSESFADTIIEIDRKISIINWILVVGSFAYFMGNNYALVANYPLLLSNWFLRPETFYQGWTIRRTINDYMMAAYVICMTEALRQV